MLLGSSPDRRIGSHTKTSGGLAKAALPYVDAAGSETLQVYVSNSRGWAMPPGDPKQDVLFRDGIGEREIPAYIHASLLVNLGSPTELTVEKSAAVLAHALERGQAIGATAVVFHAGSSVDEAHEDKAFHQLHEALLPLLERPGLPQLLVEPSAGGGRSLASKVQELERYLDAVENHPGLGVCFDTCHAWAAGHDLATPGGMTATLDALIATVGRDRLKLIHANDSKDDCGSTRDRHETIGAGRIGTAAFAELMTHPATAGVPVIVETPSVEHEGHAADIALLKSLR
ncbi:deoxyribonuclease IV [Paractinoplanes lichenicola]|uniref:Probable endonuclease 4 n=1 Tax=Paractinoplanes lichenicola TaxID=2802976 RepID=A0ABS1VP71_9ACTN|nr:deoxyribonuclease IV [Actinoplanes lichenicola]MBL7256526.1 deoxyribonuclease IV [Actinoplanes lichenicola]